MKRRKLFPGIVLIMIMILVATPFSQTEANVIRNNDLTGGIFKRKKVKQRKLKDTPVKMKGKAGKAQRRQEKLSREHDKKNAVADKKLKKHHFEIQTKKTQERMINNQKKTSENYKVKKQRIRKDSHKLKNFKGRNNNG